MSLCEFFRKGFYLSQVEPKICRDLIGTIRNTEFIKSEDYRDVGYKPPLIANWDDLSEPVVAAHNCDLSLRPFWVSFRSLLAPLEALYGAFDTGSVLINKFPSGHGMNWHSDTVDTTFVQMLIYLTSDDYTESDGGFLEMSTGYVNNSGVLTSRNRDSVKILPNNGTVVVMNNLVPTMVHRVEPLVSQKERLTLVFRYGYLTNTLTKRRLQIMKGEIHA